MPDALVLVGLTIGAILYALLIRRRQQARAARGELASSTQVALARVSEASRRSAEGRREAPVVEVLPKDEPPGRRSNLDRRHPDRRRGRGRRKGGDRRGEGSPKPSGGAPPSP